MQHARPRTGGGGPVAAAVTRRGLLGGLLVATASLVAACRRAPVPITTTHHRQAVDPDVTLAGTVVSAEERVWQQIQATVAVHPHLTRTLAPVAAVHAAHVSLLASAVPPSPTPSRGASPTAGISPSPSSSPFPSPLASAPTPSATPPTPSAGGSSSPSAAVTVMPPLPSDMPAPSPPIVVPRHAPAALLALARAEEVLTRTNQSGSFAALSGPYARVLASMAGAAAQQAVVLTEASRGHR